jgi:hypothetical protein
MTQYPLRLPDHVMSQVKAVAAEEGVSINQLLLSFISEGVGQLRGSRMIRERAKRADFAEVERIMALVPDAPPDAGDELVVRKAHAGAK